MHMRETKRMWKPREGDPEVEVAYVSVRAQMWQVRALLQREALSCTGTWSTVCARDGKVLVRGWGKAEAFARNMRAFDLESHVLGQRNDF